MKIIFHSQIFLVGLRVKGATQVLQIEGSFTSQEVHIEAAHFCSHVPNEFNLNPNLHSMHFKSLQNKQLVTGQLNELR